MDTVVRSLRALVVLSIGASASPAWANASAVSAPTQFVQVAADRIAYRSIGRGPPMILLNRMRGTLDTWDDFFANSGTR
jgi:hypothetical protein